MSWHTIIVTVFVKDKVGYQNSLCRHVFAKNKILGSLVVKSGRSQNAEPYSMEYLNGVPLKIMYWLNKILHKHAKSY